MILKLIEMYKKNELINLPLYKLSRSKEFWHTYNFLKETETWNEQQIKEWQLNQLKSIVDYAYSNVPFYKTVYEKIGYEIGGIKTFDDFEKLPFITKEDIKNHTEDFISKEIDSIPHIWNTTSGSTDKPLKFIIDKELNVKEEAYYYYYWEKYGYTVGDRRIIIRGHQVADLNKKKFYQFENIRNTVLFDSDFLSDSRYFEIYDKQIKKFKGQVLSGYPSSIFTLAKNYEVNNIKPPQFDLIILASENTYENQSSYIKKCFNAKEVIYQYGHSEKALLAFKYKNNEKLGFSPTYGYMEMSPSNENYGEIVGTSFSKSMPLIRYKTGDIAQESKYQSDDFMRNYRSVKRIEGRLHEFVFTSDNRKISLVSVAGAHIPELSVAVDMQYEQFKKGELFVNIVENTEKKITSEEKQLIINALENKFNHKMKVYVKVFEEIERTKRNKKIMLIQHIK